MTRWLTVALAIVLGITGCSGDDGDDSTATTAAGSSGGQPLRIEAMPAAVQALEQALGGEQRYFEVNATPTLVNLFVAGDGTAAAYVYDVATSELGEPAEPLSATGDTFSWDDVDFLADEVLTDALAQLPSALPRTFAVTAGAEGALQYLVTLESRQGGVLDVLVTNDGEVIGVQAR